VSGVEETLAREAQQRPRAGAAAIAAGVLTLAGNVLLAVLFSRGPGEEDGFISLPDALSARMDGNAPREPSLFVRQVEYYGDNVVLFVLATLLTVAGVALAGLTLVHLHKATVARTPQTGKLPLIMAVAGATFFAVGRLVRDLVTWFSALGFDGTTAQEAKDALASEFVFAGAVFDDLLGPLFLGVGFVLVALNAMRAGLLTRFLGILGALVGLLAVIRVDQPQVVRAVWLVLIGLLILGRRRGGLLPAWETGRAHPWPSQQTLREARQGQAAPPADDGDAPAQKPQQRRKRKRRS
jgi:hypothetical protein